MPVGPSYESTSLSLLSLCLFKAYQAMPPTRAKPAAAPARPKSRATRRARTRTFTRRTCSEYAKVEVEHEQSLQSRCNS
jgi:hypothetical protein